MTIHDAGNTCEMDAGTTATLQHVEMLHERQQKLVALQAEAEEQLFHRIGVAHRRGDISRDQLLAVFMRLQKTSRPGRATRWEANIGVQWNWMARLSRNAPNGPRGSWIGTFPFEDADPLPPAGIAVVYVLLDADNQPCYVGSSSKLRTRLKRHAHDKEFIRWQAYPARDREHAYELEDRLLKERMPRLNRKAGR